MVYDSGSEDDGALFVNEDGGRITTYRDLIVWQKSMDLVEEAYRVSSSFPGSEQFGLTSQLRRCAVSIPSNIAEGYGRWAGGDYKRFLHIAHGSLCELQTQAELARRLGFVSPADHRQFLSKSEEIERMLSRLIKRLS